MERLKLSVCGQLHKEMKTWQNSSFRRSYLGKGHGGQRRGFKVKFLGEGVDDYGGPYRAVFGNSIIQILNVNIIILIFYLEQIYEKIFYINLIRKTYNYQILCLQIFS
jgi:hypothetical protein